MDIGGTLQGKYVIERCLGEGGMGSVYLARQPQLGNRYVAIKHMHAEVDDPGDRARLVDVFRAEARLLAGLSHPALANVFDYFEEGDDHWFVMTYVEGRTLEQLFLDPRIVLRLADVLSWVLQICDVLSYLHGLRPPVIYRDLKPSNVMLDPHGKIWLLDFGIAKFVDNDNHTATLLKGAGTVRYASIEQVGMTSTDERADIYALGATLYTLLTRTLPPPAAALVTDPAQMRPRRINPNVPPALEDVVCRMTAVHKEDRYASIAEVVAALRAVMPSVEALPPEQQAVLLPAHGVGGDASTHEARPTSESTLISVKGRDYLVDVQTLLPAVAPVTEPAPAGDGTRTQVRPPAPAEGAPEAPDGTLPRRGSAPARPLDDPSRIPASDRVPGRSRRARRRVPGRSPGRWILAVVLLAALGLASFMVVRAFGQSAPLVLNWSDRPLSLRLRSERIQPSDGMSIPPGTVISTPRSQRNLFTRESSELRVASDSEVTYHGLETLPSGQRRLLLGLARGRVWLLVGSGQPWAVQAGDVLVRPQEGIVQIDHVNASCTVTVWQGRAEAVADDHPDKIVLIKERQQATWTPDETLLALHPIAMKKGDAWISWCLSDTLK